MAMCQFNTTAILLVRFYGKANEFAGISKTKHVRSRVLENTYQLRPKSGSQLRLLYKAFLIQ